MSQIQEPLRNRRAYGEIADMLRAAGLRPTSQRLALGKLLFTAKDRHVSAEELHAEAARAGYRVSLATVYNTLHQFTHAGLLREVAIEGARTYFDTNTADHYHFYMERDGVLLDIDEKLTVNSLPEIPEGMEVSRVDILVRLTPKDDD